MTAQVDIKDICKWSDPQRRMTARGPRDLLTAIPTDEFRAAWKSDKEYLRNLGLGWSQNKQTGEWSVCWWRAIEGQKETEAASHAVSTNVAIPHPKDFDYFPFQKAGIAFALSREGTYIGDEMGLGKTVQAIGVINADHNIKRVLIVCPSSLKFNWAKELNRWLVRRIPVSIVEGRKGTLPSQGIVIVNYDLLSFREKQLTSELWDLAVLDESHYIKDRKTARAMAVAGVWVKEGEEIVHPGIKARRRIAMTGTPVMNKVIELFETLRWLDPSWNRKRSKFAATYCGACIANGWDCSGSSNLDQLQAMLRQNYMIRRLKSEVLTELPAKQRTIIEFEPDANMRAILESELKEWEARAPQLKALQEAKKSAKGSEDKDAYEAAVSELKEARRVAFEEMAAVRHATAVAKLPSVIEFCKETLNDSDGKLVIFGHHHDTVNGLLAALQEFNPVKYDGTMSSTAKNNSVERFQNDASVRVFIGSIRAAGVGLTLTAASRVVFAELDWVPGVVTQAEDRCHRIGQKDSVLVQHLVLGGSLDARMAEIIVAKQRIADGALDNKHEPEAPKAKEPKHNGTTINVPQKQLFEQIPADKIEAAHHAMRILAGKCDGARALDDNGFSKIDVEFGHSLADKQSLSQGQAAYAIIFARKYRRQLPHNILDILGIAAK